MGEIQKKAREVIEAWQFTDENKNQLLHGLQSQNMGIYSAFDNGEPVMRIPTLEGEMTASLGDYIIKGISSEFYPCKPDIFLKTYEEVTNEV